MTRFPVVFVASVEELEILRSLVRESDATRLTTAITAALEGKGREAAWEGWQFMENGKQRVVWDWQATSRARRVLVVPLPEEPHE